MNNNSYCLYEFTLNETINQPIYLFYELDNYYSNHREFAKSRVWTQFRAEASDVKSFL
jgi:hypothetical protein